jgi:hypothetical protein
MIPHKALNGRPFLVGGPASAWTVRPSCCRAPSTLVDDPPRPRLPYRHLRLRPLCRTHACHSGRHHPRADRRRAPWCSPAATLLASRTAVLVLARLTSTLRRPTPCWPPAGAPGLVRPPLASSSLLRASTPKPRSTVGGGTPARLQDNTHSPRDTPHAPAATRPSRGFPTSFRSTACSSLEVDVDVEQVQLEGAEQRLLPPPTRNPEGARDSRARRRRRLVVV